MSIGILVHGRHLNTPQWSSLIWGTPPHTPGLLPTVIYTVLQKNLSNIETIVIGSGASETTDQIKESQWISQTLTDNWDNLEKFEILAPYTQYQDPQWQETLQSKILCDTSSQNTQDEVSFVANEYQDLDQIIQITSGSHGPRCLHTSTIAKHRGLIPPHQTWSVITDQTTYPNTQITDIAISEPAHRPDDALFHSSHQMSSLVQQFYQLSAGKKVQVIQDIHEVLKKYQ